LFIPSSLPFFSMILCYLICYNLLRGINYLPHWWLICGVKPMSTCLIWAFFLVVVWTDFLSWYKAGDLRFCAFLPSKQLLIKLSVWRLLFFNRGVKPLTEGLYTFIFSKLPISWRQICQQKKKLNRKNTKSSAKRISCGNKVSYTGIPQVWMLPLIPAKVELRSTPRVLNKEV